MLNNVVELVTLVGTLNVKTVTNSVDVRVTNVVRRVPIRKNVKEVSTIIIGMVVTKADNTGPLNGLQTRR